MACGHARQINLTISYIDFYVTVNLIVGACAGEGIKVPAESAAMGVGAGGRGGASFDMGGRMGRAEAVLRHRLVRIFFLFFFFLRPSFLFSLFHSFSPHFLSSFLLFLLLFSHFFPCMLICT